MIALDLDVLKNGGNIRPSSIEDVVVVKLAALSPVPKGAQRTPTHTQIPGTSDQAFNPYQPHLLPGVTLKESTASSGLIAVLPEVTKKFDQVFVGNEVLVFGYPTSIGLQETPQIDLLRPLLRKGLLAGENSLTRSIVLDCPVYQGNSGGPVIEVDPVGLGGNRLWVIGVVTQSVPYVDFWLNERQGYLNRTFLNSGYSIAAPMDGVLELTKSK